MRNIADRYWEAVLRRYPTWATALGDYRYNDRLEDLSSEGREKWKTELQGLLTELMRLRPNEVPDEDKLNYELLLRTLRDALLRTNMVDVYTPINPLAGPHVDLPLLTVTHPFRNADDFRSYLARLRAYPTQIGQAIETMRMGVRLGVAPPRVIVEKVIPQVRNLVIQDPTKSELYRPMREKAGALSESERAEIDRQLREVITAQVLPSYLRLLGFLEDEYLPRCRETLGVADLPNGRKLYRNYIWLYVTLDMEADELHSIGLKEVARIRGKMDQVRQEIGFDGSLEEFMTHMRTDPKYRFQSPEQILSYYAEVLERTEPHMEKLFTRVPKADCVMKEMEPFRAPNAPTAYYFPPPEDFSRPGYFYINTYEPHERLVYTAESLTYHEAIPGHHFQIALHQENGDLPKFRRYADFTAFVEGWALYAERLGEEIGGYQDPYQKFGQLQFEAWRACRLVVDTGIHWLGWSREQAIQYMRTNTTLSDHDIEAEVDRYIAWPGQALAYKIGELTIGSLRYDAEKTLGDRFDLRAFHDRILADGPVPLDVLKRRVEDWGREVAKKAEAEGGKSGS